MWLFLLVPSALCRKTWVSEWRLGLRHTQYICQYTVSDPIKRYICSSYQCNTKLLTPQTRCSVIHHNLNQHSKIHWDMWLEDAKEWCYAIQWVWLFINQIKVLIFICKVPLNDSVVIRYYINMFELEINEWIWTQGGACRDTLCHTMSLLQLSYKASCTTCVLCNRMAHFTNCIWLVKLPNSLRKPLVRMCNN